VRVNEVRAAANPSSAAVQVSSQQRPQIQGHWTSHDPEALQKSITVQVFGDAVTGQWSSPGFSLDITTPLPKNIHGSVSLDEPTPKDGPTPKDEPAPEDGPALKERPAPK
jgi:hypothetical protein